MPSPSNPWQQERARAEAQKKARDETARQQFFDSGREPKKPVEKPQDHHVASDKDPEFKPKFEAVFEAASVPGLPDLDLGTAQENRVSIPGHKGAHGKGYNQEILDRLNKAVEGRAAHTQEYRDALTGELHKLKLELLDPTSDLNKIVTRRK
ncbi:AHH domain-containing protein [Streptomyces diastatochromogenes]|nr:AHH domain-containing protein [Streptomyces diastatochromogenes]